jgi:hypothetical protein
MTLKETQQCFDKAVKECTVRHSAYKETSDYYKQLDPGAEITPDEEFDLQELYRQFICARNRMNLLARIIQDFKKEAVA